MVIGVSRFIISNSNATSISTEWSSSNSQIGVVGEIAAAYNYLKTFEEVYSTTRIEVSTYIKETGICIP